MKIRFLVLLALLPISFGCRHMARQDCQCIDTRIADLKSKVQSDSCIGVVNSCFDGIEELDNQSDFSLDGFLKGRAVALELEECCCIAAVNNPIADVIDKERKAACNAIGYNQCLDKFLAGQALQQRNKAASIAGELFLRLVEIHLQKDLVKQSFVRLQELKEASRFAAEQGFATDKADKELDANEIALNRKLLDIEKNQLDVTVKLSAVLGVDGTGLKIVEPVFDLFPVYEQVVLEQEIKRALHRRPDLAGFTNDCGDVDPECYLILSQLDPRLGIGLAKRIKKCVLLQRLMDSNDTAQSTRKRQLQKMKEARRNLVRAEVADSVIDIEAGYRELVLENADLERINTRQLALKEAGDLNPQDSYIESVKLWVETQTVKSRRISSAINYEIAKVKLLEATGEWIEICGLNGQASHNRCNSCSR